MKIRVAWGLDIGNSALKLARVEESGGRIAVQTFGPVALPAEAPGAEALAHGLETLLTSSGARRAVLNAALPRSAATIKFPHMPRSTPAQLAQMVRFEAQRYVPFAIEDVVLSFQELPANSRPDTPTSGGTDLIEILLAAVRRDLVLEYRAAVSAAGGSLSHLSVSTLGLWNAVTYSGLAAEPDEALVVFDIGGKSSTVLAVHSGEMIFNRSAGVGSDSLTAAMMADGVDRVTAESRKRDYGVLSAGAAAAEGPLVREATREEEWIQSLVSELRRSLAALRGEHRSLRVERLLLAGGGAKTAGLAAYLESALGMPTHVLELPGLTSDPQFIEAAGAGLGALERGASSIDLVPEEIEREKSRRRERLHVRLAGIVGAVLLAGAVALGVSALQRQEANQAKIDHAKLLVDAADRKLKAARADSDRLVAQAAMLQTALRPSHPWLDILQDVADRAPSGVWLTGVDLEKGKSMDVRGTATNQASVQALWSNLSRSALLARPTLAYANQAKVGEKEVFQFGITSDIVGNHDKPARPARRRTVRPSASATADTATGSTSATASTSAGG